MEKYEKETGKNAIWKDTITEGFKKWLKGDKVYEMNKERITFLVSEGTRNEWQKFMEKQNLSTFSKLIRKAITYYIETSENQLSVKTISNLSHNLKEPLTTIKGYTHLLIENYRDKLGWEVLSKIKDVYDQSLLLERIINEALNVNKMEEIDILIIDDDSSTNKVLSDIFKMKDYKCKTTTSASEVFEILTRVSPKVILLDIILPESNGYEICKKIKEQERFKDIPIYYITAVPISEVEEQVHDTGAEGYFLKPFNFAKFEILDQLLSKN
ncbi:MAG: response regulator [Promethearchaeota archaeon]|jgi:CheY-like chemotaxis protein